MLVLAPRVEVGEQRRHDRIILKSRSPWCRSSRGSRSARAARRTCQQGNAAAGGGSMKGAAGGDDAGGAVDPAVGDDCSGRTGRPRAAARRPEEQHVHILHLVCLAGSPTSCSSSRASTIGGDCLSGTWRRTQTRSQKRMEQLAAQDRRARECARRTGRVRAAIARPGIVDQEVCGKIRQAGLSV